MTSLTPGLLTRFVRPSLTLSHLHKTLIVFVGVVLSLYSSYSHAEILQSEGKGGVIYILENDPNQIRRYDVNSASWLPSISLASAHGVRAMGIGDAGIFVSAQNGLWYFTISNGSARFLSSTNTGTGTEVLTVNGYGHYFYFLNGFPKLTTFNESTLQLVSTTDIFNCNTLAAKPESSKVICHGTYQITELSFDQNGSKGSQRLGTDSHTSYKPNKIWLSGDYAIDNTGYAYRLDTLNFAQGVGGKFDDLTLLGSDTVLLREKKLTRYDQFLNELGEIVLDKVPVEIYAWNSSLYIVYEDQGRLSVSTFDSTDFAKRTRAVGKDAATTHYTPTQTYLDHKTGILYLLSREHANIFRWDVNAKRYLEPIRLMGDPLSFTISNTGRQLIYTTKNGQIRRVILDAFLSERHLTTIAEEPGSIFTENGFIFVEARTRTYGYPFDGLYSFTLDGDLRSYYYPHTKTSSAVWFPSRNEFYYVDESVRAIRYHTINTQTSEVVFTQGIYGRTRKTAPLTVSTDSRYLMDGNGYVIDLDSKSEVAQLTGGAERAAWAKNWLYTLDNGNVDTIRVWRPNLSLYQEVNFHTDLVDLFVYNQTLILLENDQGRTVIHNIPVGPIKDTDKDTFADISDNCPVLFNPNQKDFEGDGVGNACDHDDDNDGLPDAYEIANGLEPHDKYDRGYDLDGDGVSNYREYLAGTSPAKHEGTRHTKAYFPLRTGMRSNYQRQVNGTVSDSKIAFTKGSIFNGKATTALHESQDHSLTISSYSNDEHGLYLHEQRIRDYTSSFDGLTITYLGGIKLLNPTIRLGDSFISQGDVVLSDPRLQDLDMTYSVRSTVLNEELIRIIETSYAGIKVGFELTITITDGEQYFSETETSEWWLVKNIGLVKSNSMISDSSGTSIRTSRQLLDINFPSDAAIYWQNSQTGNVWQYVMDAHEKTSSRRVGNLTDPNWELKATPDLNGDGYQDLVFRDRKEGKNWAWIIQDGVIIANRALPVVPLEWEIIGSGNLNADRYEDLFWRHRRTGQVWAWLLSGHELIDSFALPTVSDPHYKAAGISDLDADGDVDFIWRNDLNGRNWVWIMENNQVNLSREIFKTASPWTIQAVTDITGDAKADVIWRNTTTGQNWFWEMSGFRVRTSEKLRSVPDLNWSIIAAKDFNNDRYSDLVWRNKLTGLNWYWGMDKNAISSSEKIDRIPSSNWKPVPLQ